MKYLLMVLFLTAGVSVSAEKITRIQDGRTYLNNLSYSLNVSIDMLTANFESEKSNLSRNGKLDTLPSSLPSMAKLAVRACNISNLSTNANDFYLRIFDRKPTQREIELAGDLSDKSNWMRTCVRSVLSPEFIKD